MKAIFKIFLVGGLGLALTSCGSSGPYYGNQYPDRYPTGSYPSGGVYRTPEGTVYKQGDIYRDANGNVYQNGRVIRRDGVYGRPGILSRGGNVYGNNKQLPPGQAKKIYGGRAKDYAPGQMKKRHGGYYENDRRWRDYDDDYGKKQRSLQKLQKEKIVLS